MRRPLVLAALLALIGSWNVALFAAPRVADTRVSAMTYLAGSLVCHQRPERSFHLGDAQLPVCARCLGLYVGAACGVVGWMLLAGTRSAPRAATARWLSLNVRRALIVASLPTLLTVVLAWLTPWDAPNVARATLALPFGAVAAAMIAAVAAGDLR